MEKPHVEDIDTLPGKAWADGSAKSRKSKSVKSKISKKSKRSPSPKRTEMGGGRSRTQSNRGLRRHQARPSVS